MKQSIIPGGRATIPVRKKLFLDELAKCANVSEACRRAGFSTHAQVYQIRGRDPKFAQAWDEALEQAIDRLEGEAWRRGVEGIDKPVIYKGEITGTYKEYSDTLLIQLLKAHRPEKYRDNYKVEHAGRIEHEHHIAQEHFVDSDGYCREVAIPLPDGTSKLVKLAEPVLMVTPERAKTLRGDAVIDVPTDNPKPMPKPWESPDYA